MGGGYSQQKEVEREKNKMRDLAIEYNIESINQ